MGATASEVQEKPRHSINGFTGAEAAPAFIYPLSCRDGRIFLRANQPPFAKEDWIGLYQGRPGADNLLDWFYVKDQSLLTNLRRGQNLYVAYWTMADDGTWGIVDEVGPEHKFCS
jgi:hypothetical protein